MSDWRPDWQCADEYTFMDALGMRSCAWEFLRRNIDYQEDWESFWREHHKAIARFGPTFVSPQAAGRELLKRWGIHGFVDPADDRPGHKLVFRYPNEPIAITAAENSDSVTVKLGEGEVLVKLKLQLALEPQLASARMLLGSMQIGLGVKVRKQRRHKANWKLYLRLLDARAAGVTYTRIAAELFTLSHQANAEKKAEDTFRRAKKMTTPAGYLGIL
jgi:hypothetical protein